MREIEPPKTTRARAGEGDLMRKGLSLSENSAPLWYGILSITVEMFKCALPNNCTKTTHIYLDTHPFQSMNPSFLRGST